MKKVFKLFMVFLLLLALAGAGTGAYFWYIWSSNLPYIGSLKEYRPPIISEVYADNGEVIGRFWDEKRIIVPLEVLPHHVIHAFVAAEDDRFFEHNGVDISGIIRAFYKNLTTGRRGQGGSTITQQVTRWLLLKNMKKTYRRKAREALLAMQIEKQYSKEKILFLYLNHIPLGRGSHGVETAARTYFGKEAKDLLLAESALLAGLTQAPERYSPIRHFNRAKARQIYVLERMLEERYISEQQLQNALEHPIEIVKNAENTFYKAPYFTEHVRRVLLNKYGREQLYRGGMQIFTTLDLEMQKSAVNALKKGLLELDKREGYRGPIKNILPEEFSGFRSSAQEKILSSPPQINDIAEALVLEVDDESKTVRVVMGEHLGLLELADMNWAREPDSKKAYYNVKIKKPSSVLTIGDVLQVRIKAEGTTPFKWRVALEQPVEVQGALLCMAAESGEIKAMVGGRDFTSSQFNRAIQSKRQPGSAFKPIIYAAALDKGMSPARILMDSPYISDKNPSEEVWKPKNYVEKFFGPTLFRTGLVKSRNVITVKILKEIGIEYAIQYAKKMGIESELSPDLSLALGSSGTSLMEVTRAYVVFANNGKLVEPIFIKKILDRDEQVIEENQPITQEVISKSTAYVMTDLLQAAVQEGTGWRIKALKRPAAGKTGTSNNLRDAWFMGYTPGLVTGVWVGYDDQNAMGKGETGSRAASPIWLYFVSDVLEGKPVVGFNAPEGVVFAKIDAKNGLLAGPHSEKTVFQAFKEGTDPKEHSPKPKSAKSGQFFQFDMEESK